MNRREQIIACTRELYEEKGLTKTSVQDIADKVGVARSLFY
ncbi:MAG: TetR/AcrR family transcriptional regulator, partial [Slackia sp.]